ncbi:LAGLIDADG family homing endonuclease [Marinobacterium sp. xm-d-509]|uniref:LAGLIDADG family homing endonuclease n=1 Tax=Marinobacterium sp. xm-d-509 TaxID=2497739 RepID=UPI001568BB6E|nr:LAGLIDADG family homing endonuclease [Marinobacterium sp. xm-d-509]NRP84105.1 hypothetical protein [Marinobacterium sp. xm-d-509]
MNLAYIAGFFDGEGCVSIAKNGSLTVSVVNTSLPVLEMMVDVLGVGVINNRTQKVNKRQYAYRAYGDDAAAVLRSLLPFLIEKKPQAETALDYFDNHRGGVRKAGVKGLFKNPMRDVFRAKLTEQKFA